MQKLENWSIHTTSDGQEKVLIAEVTARHNIDGSALNTGWNTQATTTREAEQIAALITAAPDLLDALKRIINHNGKPTNAMFFDAIVAIEKAEGVKNEG